MNNGFRWLPKEELSEVITQEDAANRFVAGKVNTNSETLTLLRGNFDAVVVPFALLRKSGDGTTPDFDRLELTDYGRTVALGDYEAATDAILYELDPSYRRRLNRQRWQAERTFGAALMRLRKQKRLKRGDFTPISAKEIARLERNEIEKPHARTLEVIAGRLSIQPEEIGTF